MKCPNCEFEIDQESALGRVSPVKGTKAESPVCGVLEDKGTPLSHADSPPYLCADCGKGFVWVNKIPDPECSCGGKIVSARIQTGARAAAAAANLRDRVESHPIWDDFDAWLASSPDALKGFTSNGEAVIALQAAWKAALERHRLYPQPPEGWKLVPLEATDDMVANIRRRQLRIRETLGIDPVPDDKWAYAAMVMAAPQPPGAEGPDAEYLTKWTTHPDGSPCVHEWGPDQFCEKCGIARAFLERHHADKEPKGA